MPSISALCGNPEQRVDEAHFVLHASLTGEAVSSPDHAHDFEALNGRRRRFHRLKASGGLDDLLQRAMIRFNDVVQIF